jgi:hypothetical protein
MSDTRHANRFIRWILRWQEQSLLLPLMLLLGICAWLFFGALDRTAVIDVLVQWVNLPPKAGYAVAALGLTHLARKRWRQRFTDAEQAELRTRLLAGERGALRILYADLVFTLVVIAILMQHFELPS